MALFAVVAAQAPPLWAQHLIWVLSQAETYFFAVFFVTTLAVWFVFIRRALSSARPNGLARLMAALYALFFIAYVLHVTQRFTQLTSSAM